MLACKFYLLHRCSQKKNIGLAPKRHKTRFIVCLPPNVESLFLAAGDISLISSVLCVFWCLGFFVVAHMISKRVYYLAVFSITFSMLCTLHHTFNIDQVFNQKKYLNARSRFVLLSSFFYHHFVAISNQLYGDHINVSPYSDLILNHEYRTSSAMRHLLIDD